jgi:hypothetical protein
MVVAVSMSQMASTSSSSSSMMTTARIRAPF